MTRQGPPSRLVLGFACLGPPLAWALHIGARYPLVPLACTRDQPLVLHTVTIAAMLVILGSSFVAFTLHRTYQRTPRERDTTSSRVMFLSRLGLAFSALFSVIIVAEWLPSLMQDACADVRTQ